MERLRDKYARLWAEAREHLAAGTYLPDPPPRHGEPRWGLSLVALVDGHVREAVARDLGPIGDAVGAQHFVYRPNNLHLTIRSLEGYQDPIPAEQLDYYAAQVADAAGAAGQIEVDLTGLGGSRGGVFVCGYPNDGVVRLRERLHELGSRRGPRGVPSNDYSTMRDTAHVSLAVFQAPATPERRIADFVATRATTRYGKLKNPRLALVSYTLSTGSIEMNILRTIETVK